jgi:hypothetical protein
MSPIHIKLKESEFDGPDKAPVRDEIAAVAREALARVSCNQSAILPDNIVRGHAPSDASGANRGQSSSG